MVAFGTRVSSQVLVVSPRFCLAGVPGAPTSSYVPYLGQTPRRRPLRASLRGHRACPPAYPEVVPHRVTNVRLGKDAIAPQRILHASNDIDSAWLAPSHQCGAVVPEDTRHLHGGRQGRASATAKQPRDRRMGHAGPPRELALRETVRR